MPPLKNATKALLKAKLGEEVEHFIAALERFDVQTDYMIVLFEIAPKNYLIWKSGDDWPRKGSMAFSIESGLEDRTYTIANESMTFSGNNLDDLIMALFGMGHVLVNSHCLVLPKLPFK